MTSYLIDANVLIALSLGNHPLNTKANIWFNAQHNTSMLLCPIAEGALFRYVTRNQGTANDAIELLQGFLQQPNVRRIPDDLHYDDANWKGVRGHRQITDVYLTELAARHGAMLATFDQGIAALRPDATFLIH